MTNIYSNQLTDDEIIKFVMQFKDAFKDILSPESNDLFDPQIERDKNGSVVFATHWKSNGCKTFFMVFFTNFRCKIFYREYLPGKRLYESLFHEGYVDSFYQEMMKEKFKNVPKSNYQRKLEQFLNSFEEDNKKENNNKSNE